MIWLLDALKNPDFGYNIIRTSEPIDYNRNLQVRAFLRSKHDYLFFVDSDAVPGKGAIEVLLDHGKPVSLVPNLILDRGIDRVMPMVYTDKELEGQWSLDYAPVTKGFSQVDGSGMSGLLVAREVFLKLEDPWFKFIYANDGQLVLGEDVYFYRNVRHAGYEVWCEFALTQQQQHWKTVDLGRLLPRTTE